MPFLDSSSSTANKDTMSKMWSNGNKLSDRVENIVGKGEIARYEQFLLFPQCFQKLPVLNASKWVSVEKRVNSHMKSPSRLYLSEFAFV